MPPPSVSPATPVCPTTPTGHARPYSCAARSSCSRRAPPWTRAIRFAGSISTARMPDRSMTTPPSHVEKPATLWPPPRTAMTRSCSRAKRTAVTTSSTRVHRAMSAGWRSAIAFQTTRLELYSRSPGWISSPRKPFRSFSSEAASRLWVTVISSPLAPHPWKLYREDRRKGTGDDLSARLAEHETDCCDELAVPARDRLSTLHELISIERERLRLDLVPAVREQDVLDLVELNTESHLAPPWCPTLCARAQGSAVRPDPVNRVRLRPSPTCGPCSGRCGIIGRTDSAATDEFGAVVRWNRTTTNSARKELRP